MTAQSPPPVTQLLPEGHTYSNMVTLPYPVQVVTLPDDHIFKYMSLWEAFLFKPPQ